MGWRLFALAMILPQNLAPLPVGPRDEEVRLSDFADGEEFVLSHDVYRVLLGTSGGLPVDATASVSDDETFAGRSDIVLPRTSPFLKLSDRTPVEEADVLPFRGSIHPIFESLNCVRRAAPPRVSLDVEREFGTTPARGADRWWMLGVAMAVAAVTLSGTFVDFTSREAVRRAGMEVRDEDHPHEEPARLSSATRVGPPTASEKSLPLIGAQGAGGTLR